ncbi:MAG: peptidylprolyl isomerase [Paludibacteraceae bacterium]|nr:peptidylprolyl isomerase [Paludibacteraceae bacterium]
MKKLFSAALLAAVSLCSYCQTAMTVAGEDISKQEFEYYYKKNIVYDSVQMPIDEYTERFINFKLKVAEAKSRKMDTIASFRKELESYRNQLITPYLVDSVKIKELAQEEYTRLLEDVNVSHMLFRTERNGDTITAYNKAKDALARLEKEKFEDVAKSLSEDPSMQGSDGKLGWITGLTTVYPFENAAYNTPVGQHSGIVRTVFGYHIVKVNDRRTSRGQVKVAHIFFRKKNTTPTQLDSLKSAVYSVYDQLTKEKISFAEAAAKYSDDATGKTGGELPWVTTGKTNEIFEDAAFALEANGQISAPVEAPYGWHIIQLIDKKPIPSFSEMKGAIESRMNGDERREIIYRSFIDKLKKEYNFKPATTGSDSVIATFADVTLTKDSLNKFIESNANIGVDTLDSFFSTALFEYEKNNLEKKHPEFGLLMNEYHDGILMFNISQDEIWSKAAKDTAGMRAYFEANREKYKWDTPHYKGIIVHCISKDVMKRAKKMLSTVDFESAYQCLMNLNINGKKVVKLEKGVYSEGKNAYIDYLVFKKGKLPENKKYPEVFVTGKMLGFSPETYKDIKGPVLNDYQTVIERQWIDSLKKVYPVTTYPMVISTVK